MPARIHASRSPAAPARRGCVSYRPGERTVSRFDRGWRLMAWPTLWCLRSAEGRHLAEWRTGRHAGRRSRFLISDVVRPQRERIVRVSPASRGQPHVSARAERSVQSPATNYLMCAIRDRRERLAVLAVRKPRLLAEAGHDFGSGVAETGERAGQHQATLLSVWPPALRRRRVSCATAGRAILRRSGRSAPDDWGPGWRRSTGLARGSTARGKVVGRSLNRPLLAEVNAAGHRLRAKGGLRCRFTSMYVR